MFTSAFSSTRAGATGRDRDKSDGAKQLYGERHGNPRSRWSLHLARIKRRRDECTVRHRHCAGAGPETGAIPEAEGPAAEDGATGRRGYQRHRVAGRIDLSAITATRDAGRVARDRSIPGTRQIDTQII